MSASAAVSDDRAAALGLLTAAAIRARCRLVMAEAEAGRLAHFAYHAERLDDAADYVVDTIRARYPDLAVPYHSRWRHFEAGGVDRWRAPRAAFADKRERARASFDLAIVSVLLDAGAGDAWRYREAATGLALARSEGLAVASFAMMAAGAFGAAPWRADAGALAALDAEALARGFQVGADNPLVGLDGRLALLRRLGGVIAETPAVFGAPARVGHLFDHLAGLARGGALPAARVLEVVLQTLGPIWPSRLALGGVALGDVWRHPAARAADASDRLVPFHKLSQWLTYSLLEPLEDAGVTVTGLDDLTGLPEYRNGGLLLDLGVLTPKDPALATRPLAAGDEPVVEWRALTVMLLDRLAERVRARLGLDAAGFPLAKVLEGGTWAAGRRIAATLRPGGAPPLAIVSDGTVF